MDWRTGWEAARMARRRRRRRSLEIDHLLYLRIRVMHHEPAVCDHAPAQAGNQVLSPRRQEKTTGDLWSFNLVEEPFHFLHGRADPSLDVDSNLAFLHELQCALQLHMRQVASGSHIAKLVE